MGQKILIEFILIKSRMLSPVDLILRKLSKKNNFPIQGRPFYFGLKVTNIGTLVFPGATIKNIRINPVNSVETLMHPIEEEFAVPGLNPNISTIIPIRTLTTLLEGLLTINCSVLPLQASDTINVYQKDSGSGQFIDPLINRWQQEFFVLSEAQVSSSSLNRWVALLTLLTFLQGVFGLKAIVLAFLDFLANSFIYIGKVLLSVLE